MIKTKAKISIGQGIPGRDIVLRNNITHIQWKYADEEETEWKDLISLEELQASEIELQVNDTHIQWRYEYEDTWKDLISLEEITPSIKHLESAVSEKIKELNNLKNELEENESSRNETFTQKVNEVNTAISNANKVTQDTENKLVEITSEYSTLKNDIIKTHEDIELKEQQIQQAEEDRQKAESDRYNNFIETINIANAKIEDLTTLENYVTDEEAKRQGAETNRSNTFEEIISNANTKIEDLTALENYITEEEVKRQEAETNRTNNFNEKIENTNDKIKEADEKIVDVEKRMKYIENNFGELVSGEEIVTKEYLENKHYNKASIDEQMSNKADSNHTHDYLPNTGGKLKGRLDLGHNNLVFMDEDSGDIIFLSEDGTYEKARIFSSADSNGNSYLTLSTQNRAYNLEIGKDKFRFNGNSIYHNGYKPTPNDIGASPSDHKHLGFEGTRQPLEIQEWIDFHFLNSGTDYDGRLYLSLDGFRVNSPNGNGRIYHEGFKPSVFDIGAMADFYLGNTPIQSETSEYMNIAGVFRCSKWTDIQEVTHDGQATILSLPYNSGWKTQIAIDPHSGQMFVRHINNSSILFNWTKIAYTSTFSLFQEVEKELTEMELGIYQNQEVKTLNLNLETEEEKSPFDNTFKTKWWKIYKELRVKEHIQRLYNLNLITKDDYIKIVKEEPKEKYQPNNIFTKFRQDILNQDLALLEQDLRLMSIENTFNKDINTFNLSGLNNNSYNLLLRIIENKNYKDKSEIINIIEFYHGNNKISDDNKNNLIKLINSK